MWCSPIYQRGNFRKKKWQITPQRSKHFLTMIKSADISGQHTSKSSTPSQPMYMCGVYLDVGREADSIWLSLCLSDHCESPSPFEIQLCIKGCVLRSLKSDMLHILIETFCSQKHCCQCRPAEWNLEKWEVPQRRRTAFQSQEETPLYRTTLCSFKKEITTKRSVTF